jgi:hypothetical protein
MDITTLLIGFGSIAIFIVPIFAIQWINKRNTVKKVDEIKLQAQSSGINISKYEVWNDQFIGIDSISKKVYFQKNIVELSTGKIIDLADFEECKLSAESSSKSKSNSNSTAEKVNLCLKCKNPKLLDLKVCFYDNNVNMTMRNEMEVAKKWEKIISESLV